ncbi:FHA domain-containing protein [Streptomyces sp. NA04227]|uniref:DUF1707 and FHA domain-containing protein n=1 Tax=Streptomyces sp. NA04227 TaxID=2742136 RepID=UPI001591576F|nr:DUF1707 and FHA domain-containing protein [Streptomyces sp. NA04227]QKW09921.1 FHA domain-containing protein [Streptomyces sp. NA04227]
MTSSYEFPAVPARLSDAERDQALQVLREGAAAGKLSHDTFLRRMELALAARRPDQLAVLTADLAEDRSPEGPVQRAVFGGVRAVSGFTQRMRRVWQTERLPVLRLPAAADGKPLRIGREPGNGLRLSHETVSRVHAELVRQGGMWVLRDLGSSNGTCVNGRRVIGAAVVQDGDQVSFGQMSFRLSGN